MITVDVHHTKNLGQLEGYRRNAEAIKKAGVDMRFRGDATPERGADVHMFQQFDLELSTLDKVDRAVVEERLDTGTVHWRFLVEHPAVKRWNKVSVLNPVRLQNEARIRWHYRECGEAQVEPSGDAVLSDEALAKIKPGMSWATYDRLQHLLHVRPKPLKDRKIKVFFAGRADKYAPCIASHRHAMCDILATMGVRSKICRGYDLDRDQYRDVMCDSIVSPSPYGHGETCFRMFEAMFCGSIPVLPRFDFVETVYDLRIDENYIEVRSDWSNLEATIKNVLKNLDEYQPMVDRNRALMKHWWKPETVADWTRNMIEGVMAA